MPFKLSLKYFAWNIRVNGIAWIFGAYDVHVCQQFFAGNDAGESAFHVRMRSFVLSWRAVRGGVSLNADCESVSTFDSWVSHCCLLVASLLVIRVLYFIIDTLQAQRPVNRGRISKFFKVVISRLIARTYASRGGAGKP